jgi:hypothetical protein
VPREQWLQARLRWPDVKRSLAEAMDLPVVDGGSAVAEDLGDADQVEDDAGRAEGGEPVIGVGADLDTVFHDTTIP